MAVKTKPGGKKKSATEIVIPDRLYFRIGEVSQLLQLPAYVLRFWETEFPQLKPTKSSTGQRMYRRREVELALRIKTLLYDNGFTIPGAREQLKLEAKPAKAQAGLFFPPAGPDKSSLKRVRAELQELLTMLSGKVKSDGRKPARS
jgi:DNA-binding transcriptional MerR regulator